MSNSALFHSSFVQVLNSVSLLRLRNTALPCSKHKHALGWSLLSWGFPASTTLWHQGEESRTRLHLGENDSASSVKFLPSPKASWSGCFFWDTEVALLYCKQALIYLVLLLHTVQLGCVLSIFNRNRKCAYSQFAMYYVNFMISFTYCACTWLITENVI